MLVADDVEAELEERGEPDRDEVSTSAPIQCAGSLLMFTELQKAQCRVALCISQTTPQPLEGCTKDRLL